MLRVSISSAFIPWVNLTLLPQVRYVIRYNSTFKPTGSSTRVLGKTTIKLPKRSTANKRAKSISPKNSSEAYALRSSLGFHDARYPSVELRGNGSDRHPGVREDNTLPWLGWIHSSANNTASNTYVPAKLFSFGSTAKFGEY